MAIPVLTNTVGIIDRTIVEIKEIDVRTRKQLTTTGNFHQNGDVDKLYLPRSQGGRGLKMVARMFESRVIAVAQYLTINSNRSNAIKFVYEQEQQNIIRIQQKLLQCYDVEHDETSTPKYLKKQIMKPDLTAQKEKHTSKVMHGYYERKSNNNTKDKFVTSQQEDYLSIIQDQEQKELESGKTPDYSSKCRLLKIEAIL